MLFDSVKKVVEREVEGMLYRIGSKYGIAMSELRACAYGESQVVDVDSDRGEGLSVSDLDESRVESLHDRGEGLSVSELDESRVVVVYPLEVESEWLLEESKVDDVKVVTYEVVSKLCEDLESCECVLELELLWSRVMTEECVALCKSDGILVEKYEEAELRYEVLKDEYERRGCVEDRKEESVCTEMMSLSVVEEMCEWEAKIVLTRLKDGVSLCESVSEVEELWKELSGGCVSVCNSSAELSVMLQEVIKEVGAKKESLRVVSETSRSLMEESYQYVVPTVEFPRVEVASVEVVGVVVPTVEVVAPASKKAAKAKVVKEKVPKDKKEKVVSRVESAASASASASSPESAASSSEVVSSSVKVAKKEKVVKVAKEKVVKEKVVKEKVVKEKKVKESVYRGGVFASLVTAASSGVEESKEESESDVEEESSSRCYIVSKKEAACAAAQNMSSGLPRLNR